MLHAAIFVGRRKVLEGETASFELYEEHLGGGGLSRMAAGTCLLRVARQPPRTPHLISSDDGRYSRSLLEQRGGCDWPSERTHTVQCWMARAGCCVSASNRFIREIGEGNCCFICGANPGSKAFNDDRVIPDWVLAKHGLHSNRITLAYANLLLSLGRSSLLSFSLKVAM